MIAARLVRAVPGAGLALCLAALCPQAPQAATRADHGELEYEIKAEFVERFAYYVEWPAEAFASDTSAFTICVEGDSPMRANLEKILANRRIKARPALVIGLKAGESSTGCHILYLAPSEWERVEEIVGQIGDSAVLIVGDSLGFAESGVHITLFLEGSHVRFSINAVSARANGLILSAKLLALARPVAAGKR